MSVAAYKGNGIHLWRDCPDLGPLARRLTADPRTVRCGPCILRAVTIACGPNRKGIHGSHAGYNRHRAHGQEPCQDCRAAETDYQRAAKQRQRARAAA